MMSRRSPRCTQGLRRITYKEPQYLSSYSPWQSDELHLYQPISNISRYFFFHKILFFWCRNPWPVQPPGLAPVAWKWKRSLGNYTLSPKGWRVLFGFAFFFFCFFRGKKYSQVLTCSRWISAFRIPSGGWIDLKLHLFFFLSLSFACRYKYKSRKRDETISPLHAPSGGWLHSVHFPNRKPVLTPSVDGWLISYCIEDFNLDQLRIFTWLSTSSPPFFLV